MSGIARAYVGALIQDGQTFHSSHAPVAGSNGSLSILLLEVMPRGCPTEVLDGGFITAGSVDLQVNGSGGVMFNDNIRAT
ncbi:hypothetical protein [Octadecabacter antarcticus]|uniref:hypothetical protein n=1 Tax=Octadecabacter antarcticus TaxID=1217908 RepID=UPI0001806ADB|nr:hypothetical protein [Octadecabacter antarcticus]